MRFVLRESIDVGMQMLKVRLLWLIEIGMEKFVCCYEKRTRVFSMDCCLSEELRN